MPFIRTTATNKLLKLRKRIRVVAGGTSAGKTISILQILIDYAMSNDGKLISVVSESFPHLRRGSMRDFLNIMQEHGYYDVAGEWSKTDFTFTFTNGSKIEFFSADQPGKVRGPRRDVLFVNEANNIDYESFDQLRIRTKEVIWLDYNPTNEYWYYTEIAPNYQHDFITLTYKDNEALDEQIVADIESHKHNKNWWLVYGLGQLGEVEGRIYKDWNIIDELPHEAQLVRRGLDWGYSNDPTAIVDVYSYNGGYIVVEKLYRRGMQYDQIAAFLSNMDSPSTLIMADSSDPRGIDYLREHGLSVLPVVKKGMGGKNYLASSIAYVQQQRISVPKSSTNLIKEYRNYLWMTDKDGNIINEPEPGKDHALDGTRYAFDGLRPQEDEEENITSGSLSNLWH